MGSQLITRGQGRSGCRRPALQPGDVITQLDDVKPRRRRTRCDSAPALALSSRTSGSRSPTRGRRVDPGPADAGRPSTRPAHDAATRSATQTRAGADRGRAGLGVEGDLPDLELGRAKGADRGDYASSAGMKLAQALRQAPPQIAQQAGRDDPDSRRRGDGRSRPAAT